MAQHESAQAGVGAGAGREGTGMVGAGSVAADQRRGNAVPRLVRSGHRRFGRWASLIDRELTPIEADVLGAITNPGFADYVRRQDQRSCICAELGWPE